MNGTTAAPLGHLIQSHGAMNGVAHEAPPMALEPGHSPQPNGHDPVQAPVEEDGLATEVCRLVHGLPGRMRVRYGDAEAFGRLAASNGHPSAFQSLARNQPGIHAVRVNRRCQSAVVEYDTATHNEAQLLLLLATISLEEASRDTDSSEDEDADSATAVPMVLSTAAIGAGLLGGSILTPLLTLGAALPIFKRAMHAMTERRELTVDVLDAVATAVLSVNGQFTTAAVMTWLVSLGDVIRDATVAKSHRVIEDLFDGHTQTAWVVRDGSKERVPLESVQPGEIIVVYSGELIPADGTVIEGQATVDQAILTGESMPVVKDVDDEVYAGTVVRDGKIYFRATKLGADTMASKIIKLVEDAPVRETRIQNYAETFANRVVPWSLLGAGSCFLATGSINAASAFLIVDFGTGIRVAAPTTVLSSLAGAARQGILIKGGGRYLEELAEVDMVVFDKTGTLTRGLPDLVEVIVCADDMTEDVVLAIAAAAEQRLNHPFARAIEAAANARALAIPERESSHYTIGMGVEARVRGARVLVGCDRFMAMHRVPMQRAEALAGVHDEATTPVYVALDGELLAILPFRVPLHPEVPAVVRALRDRGIKDVAMITGDNVTEAERVANVCGIEWYVAGALPEEKCEFVRFLQRQGHRVALVGDGVNDSPALAQADVGIAVRGGTDVASETAHIVLLEDNLWKIPQAIDLARESLKLIRQNWHLNLYPNTAVLALSMTGILGAIGATVISNGSAVLATLNGLRPLLTNGSRRGGTGGGVTPAR